MATRYNSNHFQLLSYRIWEEYRALSANGAAIPSSSMCTAAPLESLSAPQHLSAPLATATPATEPGTLRGAEIPNAIAEDI